MPVMTVDRAGSARGACLASEASLEVCAPSNVSNGGCHHRFNRSKPCPLLPAARKKRSASPSQEYDQAVSVSNCIVSSHSNSEGCSAIFFQKSSSIPVGKSQSSLMKSVKNGSSVATCSLATAATGGFCRIRAIRPSIDLAALNSNA